MTAREVAKRLKANSCVAVAALELIKCLRSQANILLSARNRVQHVVAEAGIVISARCKISRCDARKNVSCSVVVDKRTAAGIDSAGAGCRRRQIQVIGEGDTPSDKASIGVALDNAVSGVRARSRNVPRQRTRKVISRCCARCRCSVGCACGNSSAVSKVRIRRWRQILHGTQRGKAIDAVIEPNPQLQIRLSEQ